MRLVGRMRVRAALRYKRDGQSPTATFRCVRPPTPRPTTPSCRSRSRRSTCAAAWCGSGPRSTRSCAGHNYPAPVAKLLGEAIVLTVLLGSSLKFEGRFILQTQTDGPVRMLVVDFRSPGAGARLRALRRRARGRRDAKPATAGAGALLGHGHLAMTIDQGPDMSRYQGLVALEGGDLEDAAHEYFRRSEQIPTRVRLAVGEELRAGRRVRRWRAGGILLQFLPKAPERVRQADLDPGDAPEGAEPHVVPEDDAWVEGRSLVETVEDVELIDPDAVERAAALSAVPRARRARLPQPSTSRAECSCSRDGVEAMLRSFSQDDRDHMVENGVISVTCEFCSAHYEFAPEDVVARRRTTASG